MNKSTGGSLHMLLCVNGLPFIFVINYEQCCTYMINNSNGLKL